MHRPIFSCVIPVKGERPFFKEALASLEAQGIEDDLEIIVQDGDVGSGGVEELGVGELRSLQWHREADAGQSDALNKGFAKAKGEWLFWLNADDILLSGALKKVRQLIARSSRLTTLNWIAGNQLLIDDAGKVLKCSVGNGWHDWLYRHAVPHVYGPSSFFRHELFERTGGLDVSLKYCMDWDLWIKFMKAGARFVRMPDYLWAQRQWAGSKTQRNVPEDELALQWSEVNAMLRRNGLDATRGGMVKMRLWRILNGNVLRQYVDGRRFGGMTVDKITDEGLT